MQTFYIVRHGETLLNLLNRSQGWADSPLTPKGVGQAAELGERFRKHKITFDAAYSSDMGRARQTADLILDHSDNRDVHLSETADLREASFGSFEGYNNDLMWEKAGIEVGEPAMSRKSSIDHKIKALAGIKKLDTIDFAEDYGDVRERIERLKDLLIQSAASRTLLVSHSLFICCILHVLFPANLKIDKIPNASVTKIRYSDREFYLDYIGRTDDFS